MSGLDDALEFLKMATDATSAFQDSAHAHEKAMASDAAARDTLLLGMQIDGANKKMVRDRADLKLTLRDQYTRYNKYKKDLNDLGSAIKGWETLSDEDITDAGLDFIDTTSATLRDRMFKDITSISQSEMTVQHMDRFVQKNAAVLAKLETAHNQYTTATKHYKDIRDIEGIKGVIDTKDSEAYLAETVKVNKMVANPDYVGPNPPEWILKLNPTATQTHIPEEVEMQRSEAMTELEYLGYEKGIKTFLTKEAALGTPHLKTKEMCNKETEQAEWATIADITQHPERYTGLTTMQKGDARIQAQLTLAQKDQKKRDEDVVMKINLNRNLLLASIGNKNYHDSQPDRTKGEKRIFGTPDLGIQGDYYKYDLTDPKLQAKVSTKGFDAESQIHTSVTNILMMVDKMVQSEGAFGTTKLGFSKDLGLPSDWSQLKPLDQIAFVGELLDKKNKNSILDVTGQLKTELFDIREPTNIIERTATGAGGGALLGLPSVNPIGVGTMAIAGGVSGAISSIPSINTSSISNPLQEIFGWDDMKNNQAGIDFIMTNINEFKILQDYISTQEGIDEALQKAVQGFSGTIGHTNLPSGSNIPTGSGGI